MNRIQLWSVNLRTKPGNPAFNTLGIIRHLSRASTSGKPPKFILFPELCVSGYINDTAHLFSLRDKVGQSLGKLQKATEAIPETVVLIGYPHYEGKELFIRHSAIVNGTFIHHHDKIRLTRGEKKTFTPGKSPVITVTTQMEGVRDTPDHPIIWGVLICYENHYPELASSLGDRGCDIIFAPFASPRETPRKKYRRLLRFLPARAYDNSCFLVSCNLIQEYPRTGVSVGAAVIIGPKGEILAKKFSRRESICKAVVNLEEIDRIRKSSMGYFRNLPQNG